jgi:ankyrin repeat protein
MRLLLDAGADPNAANDFAATPLMWCTGDAVKVRLLLSKGARVNVRSKLGRTPLLVAAAYDGATEAARLLIEKGADVNARDESGMSVLEQAASSNHIELVRLLLAKGADVNTADLGGGTALMSAAGNGDRNAAMVKLLLEPPAPKNRTRFHRWNLVLTGSGRRHGQSFLRFQLPYGPDWRGLDRFEPQISRSCADAYRFLLVFEQRNQIRL